MMSTISQDNLVIDILESTFGSDIVNGAMKYTACYNDHKGEKRRLISNHFNILSFEWQKGNARAYLESLDAELQNCIICYLMEDFVIDRTSKA